MARGLGEEEILKIKAELEKEIAKSYDFNWEHFKHRDALLENSSIREVVVGLNSAKGEGKSTGREAAVGEGGDSLRGGCAVGGG